MDEKSFDFCCYGGWPCVVESATLIGEALHRGSPPDDPPAANLSGAILIDAVGLDASTGSALYMTHTDFTKARVDGDRNSPGTIRFDPAVLGGTFVLEPAQPLIGLGLAGLASRRFVTSRQIQS